MMFLVSLFLVVAPTGCDDKDKSRTSECAAAKGNLKSEWKRFLLEATIENNNTAAEKVSNKIDALESDDADDQNRLASKIAAEIQDLSLSSYLAK